MFAILPSSLLLIAWVVLTGCSSTTMAAPRAHSTTSGPVEAGARSDSGSGLTVFAAASLTDAFGEIGQAFEVARPGGPVIFNFGGSQNLRTQLEQGARADVFASANEKEMNMVTADGLALTSAVRVFVTNRLVVVLPAGNPGAVQTLQDLARPGLKLILADEAVPAGRYARQVLDKLSAKNGSEYKQQVLANVVSNEDNVKQVVAKVQLGEADAGIVYASDALAARDLVVVAIPAGASVTAEYPIVALANAPSPARAAEFVDFVLSSEGQLILRKWGFTPVAPPH